MKKIKEEFDPKVMVAFTAILVITLLILICGWNGREYTFVNFLDYLQKIVIRWSPLIFFSCFSIFFWYKYFINIIIKPKKDVLYLKYIDKNKYYFYKSNGKKYNLDVDKNVKLKKHKYYNVLRTADYIVKIYGESSEKFEKQKEKNYYLLCWHTPFGNFDKIVFLPYVVFIFILVLMIKFNSVFNFNELFILIILSFLIIYDIIYKIKKMKIINKINENTYEELDEKYLADEDDEEAEDEINTINVDNSPELVALKSKSVNIFYYSEPIVAIVSGCIFDLIIAKVAIPSDIIIKVMLLPFFIAGIYSIIMGIKMIKDLKNRSE